MNPFYSSSQYPLASGWMPEPSQGLTERLQRMVHERLLAEERAERAETALQLWAQMSPGGQWTFDPNELVVRLEGREPVRLESLLTGLDARGRWRLLRRFVSCRRRGGVFAGLGCRRDEQAGDQWLELRGRLCPEGVWWGVYRDVSAEQQAQGQLRNALRMRESLLAGVSHEIRTPLGGMRGLVDLVLDGRLGADQREYLMALRGSADVLLHIVNDVLDLARLEAGGLRLEAVDFSLDTLLEETLRTLAPEAERKGVACFHALAPEVPALVRGDPLRLRQIVSNLVSNAIRFTDVGQVEVFVRARPGAGGLRLLVSVRDSGCGIPPEAQARIFEPFVQASPEVGRTHGGTGLGLSLCRQMVALMGGRIRVGSRPGRGSVFMFDVWMAQGCAAPAVQTPTRLPGRRVLVAAPNARWRRSLRAQLTGAGLDVVEAADGAAALAALARADRHGQAFDFLLLDAHMAPPGGLALVERLSAGWPRLQRVVLMCDPLFKQAQAARLAALHVGPQLLKPFKGQELTDALWLALRGEALSLVPQPPSPALQALAALPSREILLVDDSPVLQLALGAMLRQAGHQVCVAGSGQEALQLIDSHRHFDLVLLDVQLPGMDGFTTLRAIRALEARRSWVVGGEWRPMLVVALTGHALPADRQRCLDAGMDAYLSKPVQSELLLDVMRATLPDAEAAHAASPGRQLAPGWEDLGAVPVVADLDETLALLGGNRQALREIALMFVEGVERQHQELREAWRNQDWSSLRERVHVLKSGVSVFHASGLLHAAQAVEQAARAGDGAVVDELMPRFLRELQLLVGVLRKSCLAV